MGLVLCKARACERLVAQYLRALNSTAAVVFTGGQGRGLDLGHGGRRPRCTPALSISWAGEGRPGQPHAHGKERHPTEVLVPRRTHRCRSRSTLAGWGPGLWPFSARPRQVRAEAHRAVAGLLGAPSGLANADCDRVRVPGAAAVCRPTIGNGMRLCCSSPRGLLLCSELFSTVPVRAPPTMPASPGSPVPPRPPTRPLSVAQSAAQPAD
jgi:hypothetical protein